MSNEPLSALDLGDGFKKGASGREVAFVLGLHAPVPLTYLVPTFAAVAAHHFPPLVELRNIDPRRNDAEISLSSDQHVSYRSTTC